MTAPSRGLTWWGHATVQLDLGGATLLTDPLLRRASGPLRRIVDDLPTPHTAPDAVLISHRHGDHLDVRSLASLAPGTRVLAPADAVKRLRGKIDGLEQVAPGDVVEVGGAHVHVTDADHGRVRAGLPGTIDAVGYVVEDGGGRVYFAGDTDLFSGMEAIGPVDVALLPIWGWGPRLGAGHLDPRRAAEAAALLRAGTVVPIHWGTLLPVGTSRLRPRYLTEPAEAFARFAAEVAPAVQVRRLAVGERLPL